MLHRPTTRIRPFIAGAPTLDAVANERADVLAEIGMTEAELRSRWQGRTAAETRALRRLDALAWAERAV